MLSYLNLMANPKDDLAFARVVNVPPRGLGKTSLDHLIAAARQREHPAAGYGAGGQAGRGAEGQGGPRPARVRQALIDELTQLRDHPAEEVIRQLLTRTGYRDYLEPATPRDGGEDRLANLDELISAAARVRPASIPAPRSTISWPRSRWPRRSTAGTRIRAP